ncbi:ARM repeat-containing protein [Gautieria morchelliformis]|nr:ARM repeat-containing protein [Gautieria morchelliformis]
MAEPSSNDVAAVLSALTVFSSATDKPSITRANNWLQDFQHSPDAWATANVLLQSPDAAPAARLFAAQTFRAKVTFDLAQVPGAHHLQLRDTLLAALRGCAQGPRTVVTQLCLALAGLALQVPQWENVVQNMYDMFGSDPATVPVLLEFLTVFPEELSGNSKIPVSNDEYRDRMPVLLTEQSGRVLELLAMYIQSPGVTPPIQGQVFQCLRSWLSAGEIIATALAETPLLEFAFAALASNELFDSAVNVICDLIHETQELEENMSVILLIVPRVIDLRPMLATAKEDPEKVRGYTRIFSEAGETYRMLILQTPETFLPVVEAIAECTAYSDLDIVPITFPFWWRLAQSIGKRLTVPPVLVEAYSALVGIIIGHLHFPADPDSMSNQEADDFRAFRHVMGDTLKDCCHVLGTDTCLLRAYDMIASAMAATGGDASRVSWQAIEAPLFSMRSMGAEMDLADDQVIPKIMDILPSLPGHPRVRYAALLVVSRYTEWTSTHPSYIPFQLQYISAGFDDTDLEVPAAAGVAMKYLCKDCKQHLVSYLPQLHSFLNTVGGKLNQDDTLQIYEAVAYVISSMSLEEAAQSLKTFSTDILSKIHTVVNKPTAATKEELQVLVDSLEHLETMLQIVKGFGEHLPTTCRNTYEEAWALLDTVIAKYGEHYNVGDRVTRVLRYGLDLFGTAALPIAPHVLSRMATSFEAHGISGYVWIISKVIGRFGNEEDPAIRDVFRRAYESVSTKVLSLLQQQPAAEIPDVVEDYIRLLLQMVDFTPDILFPSPAFPASFGSAVAGLTLVQVDICYLALEFLRIVLTHDALSRNAGVTVPPKFPIYAQAIRDVFAEQGFQLLVCLLVGFVGDFDEETTSQVVTIFRTICAVWPSEISSWLPSVMEQLPSSIPLSVKEKFLADFNVAMAARDLDNVRNAALVLHRASRRIKARRRDGIS